MLAVGVALAARLTRYGCPVGPLPHLKSRHSPAEVARLMGGGLRLLLERLVLLQTSP